jgi:hypothetical protein
MKKDCPDVLNIVFLVTQDVEALRGVFVAIVVAYRSLIIRPV